MSRENKTQPDHYKTKHDFDVIDFNKAYNLNFNLGNVVKYIARAGKKEGESSLDDLKKAINYLQREMKSQGLFSFITGEHPTEEEMKEFVWHTLNSGQVIHNTLKPSQYFLICKAV